MTPSVGVVAIQGDFEKHYQAFLRVGLNQDQLREVRAPEDLIGLTHLVIPGGESTTVGLLMDRYGLGRAIQEASSDIAIWGTCMGMILLAKKVEDREQYTLGLLDITVRRNAFGAQINSFESEVPVTLLQGDPLLAVFIRAPIVTEHGQAVEVIASYEGSIVGVKQGRILGTSFHPELTEDSRLHKVFLSI